MRRARFGVLPTGSLGDRASRLRGVGAGIGILGNSIVCNTGNTNGSGVVGTTGLLHSVILGNEIPSSVECVEGGFSSRIAPISRSMRFDCGSGVCGCKIACISGLYLRR